MLVTIVVIGFLNIFVFGDSLSCLTQRTAHLGCGRFSSPSFSRIDCPTSPSNPTEKLIRICLRNPETPRRPANKD